MFYETSYLEHFGIKGMKWGQRRYQNSDGSLTPEGIARYNKEIESAKKSLEKHPGLTPHDEYYLKRTRKGRTREEAIIEARRLRMKANRRNAKVAAAIIAPALITALAAHRIELGYDNKIGAIGKNKHILDLNTFDMLRNKRDKARLVSEIGKMATIGGLAGAIGGSSDILAQPVNDFLTKKFSKKSRKK